MFKREFGQNLNFWCDTDWQVHVSELWTQMICIKNTEYSIWHQHKHFYMYVWVSINTTSKCSILEYFVFTHHQSRNSKLEQVWKKKAQGLFLSASLKFVFFNITKLWHQITRKTVLKRFHTDAIDVLHITHM